MRRVRIRSTDLFPARDRKYRICKNSHDSVCRRERLLRRCPARNRSRATNELCKQRTEQFLQSARVTDFDVVVEPEVIDSLTEEITVTTTVTLNAKNGFGISGFFKDRSMTKQVSLATQ